DEHQSHLEHVVAVAGTGSGLRGQNVDITRDTVGIKVNPAPSREYETGRVGPSDSLVCRVAQVAGPGRRAVLRASQDGDVRLRKLLVCGISKEEVELPGICHGPLLQPGEYLEHPVMIGAGRAHVSPEAGYGEPAPVFGLLQRGQRQVVQV